LSWIEDAKKRAALDATKLVVNDQIVGLGTGSTTKYMVDELGRRVREENLRIRGVPTSIQTADQAKINGIPLTTLDECPRLDIAIDGADQVDPNLNLIKGLGGALTREKIVDTAAKDLIIIIDERKLSERLGWNQVIPVEVIPMSRVPVSEKIRELGGNPSIRQLKNGRGPFVTDNSNYIIDVDFGVIADPSQLEQDINMIPGVVENGLFIDVTEAVFVGYREGVKKIQKSV
jgi:ribose 5-phosphate isomerase A